MLIRYLTFSYSNRCGEIVTRRGDMVSSRDKMVGRLGEIVSQHGEVVSRHDEIVIRRGEIFFFFHVPNTPENKMRTESNYDLGKKYTTCLIDHTMCTLN